jgi:hypothetical protein
MDPITHQPIPELQDVAKKHTVEALEAKVDKCYSSEKYKEFKEEVEGIVLAQLGTDKGHDVLNAYVDMRIEKAVKERGLKNKTFWVPTIISTVAALTGIGALIIAAAKP